MTKIAGTLAKMRRTIIGQNPVWVTIHRVERVDDPASGGRGRIESELGPYRCRIVQRRVNVQTTGEFTTEPGQIVFSYRYAALFEPGADVQASAQIVDEFDAPGYGHFVVREVVLGRVERRDYGITAELQKLS